MTADEVLAAIRGKYPLAALVPEVTINSDVFDEAFEHRDKERRIDALMFEQNIRTAIEVKVSRADANRETWMKTLPWRKVTHRFVYAVPEGLIEHPPVYGAGLWWVGEDGRVTVKRKATMNRTPEYLPQDVVQRLAYRAAGITKWGNPIAGLNPKGENDAQ